jgi:hypothetical protein
MKAIVILLGLATTAHADVQQEAFSAPADPCKSIGGKCTRGAKLATKVVTGDIAKATLLRGDSDDGTSFGFTLEWGGMKMLSPVVTEEAGDCAAGSCYKRTLTSKLRAITVGGDPAIALEVTAAWKKVINQNGEVAATWTTHHFVVCGKPEKGWTCVTAQFGERDAPCTASLSKTGELTSRCTKTDELAF